MNRKNGKENDRNTSASSTYFKYNFPQVILGGKELPKINLTRSCVFLNLFACPSLGKSFVNKMSNPFYKLLYFLFFLFLIFQLPKKLNAKLLSKAFKDLHSVIQSFLPSSIICPSFLSNTSYRSSPRLLLQASLFPALMHVQIRVCSNNRKDLPEGWETWRRDTSPSSYLI